MTHDISDFLVIGKIVGVHGLKGTLKVLSYAESPDIFEREDAIFCPEISESGEISEELRACEISWIKPHQRVLLMSLKGVNSRTHAEMFVGTELLIEKAALPEPGEGTYYWTDLLGLSVLGADDDYIGCIEAIIPTGSNDVYVVRDKDRETLIPALEWVVISVDPDAGIMRVDLPQGL